MESRSSRQSNASSSLFHLEPHPVARNKAVASSAFAKGTVVLSSPPLATVLLDTEKGQRCDSCLRARANLERCTACRNYWYCDSTCQKASWKAHHRRLCKPLYLLVSSAEYRHLSPSEKLHCLLLAHLLAEHAKSLVSAFSQFSVIQSEDLSDPISVMLCLLPQSDYKHFIPAINLGDPVLPDSLTTFISSRFANNNFTIYCARKMAFAHGVFPLASRSFNHSCVPSAVPVYKQTKGSRYITMEIRLLRDLEPGEEITINYTDPALPYSTRQVDLELIYGFTCKCLLCQQARSALPASVMSPPELVLWEAQLRENFLPFVLHDDPPSDDLRKEFLRTWHPSYLPPLAEEFSNTSHDGPHSLAIEQGLHALELAKTCWNAYVTGDSHPRLLQDMEGYLVMVERIFSVVFGGVVSEEEGPIQEAQALREILSAETNHRTGPWRLEV